MPSSTCLCGTCHLTFGQLLGTSLCHCTTCRKITSSAFSLNTAVSSADFKVVSGSPKSTTIPTPTGRTAVLKFCGDCGSALWIEHPDIPPGIVVLKSGVLDGDDALESEGMRPMAEQWTARRPEWICAVGGASQSERMPGKAEIESTLEEAITTAK